ncbi:methyl-accepting chemotaxis protein [Rhizobium sp. NPDC090275]|uniref:methyl-accepting chemotaxis protein n=1 Tax=Rhizobium sp. NPDC090275 TaxID=3364498 RepID=UPI00383B907A
MSMLFKSGADRILSALDRTLAIIEFDCEGIVLKANENFCRVLGYDLREIVGKHHSLFVDQDEVKSPEYRQFWSNLGNGKPDQRQYKRIAKGGREVWIEASYNPVMRANRVEKIIKFATDITAIKLKAAEDGGKLAALSRAQAIIEFTPSGEILTANEIFLATLGYRMEEIVGKHHAVFCDPAYAASTDYQRFWQELGAGRHQTAEFQRVAKGGRRVYIQASYNPILDMNGRVFKVVKFATDVTGRVENVIELATGLRKLAAGDLDHSLDLPFIPSLDSIRVDFNDTVGKLSSAMATVATNAKAISESSANIQSNTDSLARRTEQQAASVEETAAALEEVTTTVADSSHRAAEAGRLVARAKANAEHSGEIVRRAVMAMDGIARSSSAISSIISVIDGIAFQTNLLALNAGVEAARAGDAGKGFAVVAQEVRELAQRSASAAKEISSLITASAGEVAGGVKLVNETGEALVRIANEVQEIDGHVIAIVQAAQEQSTALKEINQAVNSIDQGTQQNAAMVEESNAASHALAGDARGLFELVGQFRTSQSDKLEPARSPTVVAIRTTPPRRARPSTAALAASWEEF